MRHRTMRLLQTAIAFPVPLLGRLQVPFKSWLRAASEALGGEALLRKQCNVWWWDAEADGADDALPALPCRSAAAGGAQEKRYGLWRAATIVAYDPRTATHTLKYHTGERRRKCAIN